MMVADGLLAPFVALCWFLCLATVVGLVQEYHYSTGQTLFDVVGSLEAYGLSFFFKLERALYLA